MARTRARISIALGVLLVVALLTAPGAASAHRPKIVSALAQGHPWRNGVVPKRGSSTSRSSSNLSFGGDISGVGVATGPPRVYLIFWGSQWGSQSTNSAGNFTYGGDPNAMAPDLQAFFKGLGTAGERWSGVMTQYCQGISTGAQSCPSSNSQHVGYPTGGALAGVWEDASAAAPSQATAHQIAAEAVKAAGHFGNFAPNAQYFIVSPTGTNPDGFLSSGFCAWHDYTADSTLDGGGAASSSNGPVAFTNMPYVTDAGSSCGENFVNSGSAGTLDGVTIVGGHEYAETITDTYPAGGWTDSSGNENGDKCAWISSGSGASQNITLSTGKFALQSTWANDDNTGRGGCEVSHSIVTDPTTVALSNPGNQTTTAGKLVSLQLSATDSGAACTGCTYTATGLPSGLSISSSGLISGTPTKAASSWVTVTANASGTSGSAWFAWKVLAGPATSLSVSPTSATLGLGGMQKFTASGTDAYGNKASVTSAQWTTTAAGSLSPTSGSSSTFTASGTTGTSGTVTASLGGLSASATVTETGVANPIQNGGFELGNLSGWTTSGASGAESAVAKSTSYPCHGGSYCARLGSTAPTNGDSNIAQTFTAPSGSSALSFYYDVVCPDTLQYDWATATLRDVTAGTTYTMLAKTCVSNSGWKQVSHATTPGHQYTLTLTSHDDDYLGDPTYTLYDDVMVQ